MLSFSKAVLIEQKKTHNPPQTHTHKISVLYSKL